MSKSNTLFGGKFFKFLYFSKCHLPLVVVSAVAWCTTWLLLAANINPQIFRAVVSFDAIHVIDKLIASEWTTKVLRHDESVLKNRLATSLYSPKEIQVFAVDLLGSHGNIARLRHLYSASAPGV